MIAGVRDRIRQRDEALETARRFASELAERFDDLSAVVFGSYARGDFHDGSDIDLLVLSDALPEDPMERQRILYDLTPGGIDIFAYRRDEHARMLEKNHPTAFWAAEEGVAVWPR